MRDDFKEGEISSERKRGGKKEGGSEIVGEMG